MPRVSCSCAKLWSRPAKTSPARPSNDCSVSEACRSPSAPTTACPSPVPLACSISPSSRSGGFASALRSNASSRDIRSRTAVTSACTSPSRWRQPARLAQTACKQQDRFDAFVHEFNTERPHEALGMKCPAQLYGAPARRYDGLPELTYPFHDRDVLVTACGRLCLHRKRINISSVLAGQRLGIKEVDDGIWLVSFMHYDLGYFDLEQKTLQPLDNPFGTRLSPMS